MARWEGVEPPTFWFVARCSIQLSYQRFFISLLYRPERLRIIPKHPRRVKRISLKSSAISLLLP